MMKGERSKKRNRRVKIQRTNKLPPLPKQKVSRRKEIIKIREEINKIEIKKQDKKNQ